MTEYSIHIPLKTTYAHIRNTINFLRKRGRLVEVVSDRHYYWVPHQEFDDEETRLSKQFDIVVARLHGNLLGRLE
jgi:hypothetical protein